MNKELRNSIEKFNKFVGSIDLELFRNLGETTNLKLHQVYHMFHNMNYFENIFHDFCINEYEHFEEILKGNNLLETHIGSTSSFYLEHEHFNLFDTNYQSDFEGKSPIDKLEMILFNELSHWYDINDFDIFALSITSVNEDCIEYEDIDFLRNEMEGTINIIQDIDRIYKFIEEYKESQCEHFVEFMDSIN